MGRLGGGGLAKDKSRDTNRQVARSEMIECMCTHTQYQTAIIAGEENESRQCLSSSLPDCETVSGVFAALCLCPPSLFSRLSFSHTWTTVIFLAPAPLAIVESKAPVLYHYLYRVSHYCPLQCPHYPNTAPRSGGEERTRENKA